MRPGRQMARGLQVERTQLAWERSVTGSLAASVFLLVHPDRLGPARLVLAALALVLAASVGVVGRIRARQVIRARRAVPGGARTIPVATGPATVLCCGVVVFAVATIVVLMT